MEKESNPTYHRVMENTRPQPVPQGGVFPETAPTERAASEGYGPTGDLTHPPGEVLTSLRRYLLLMGAAAVLLPRGWPQGQLTPMASRAKPTVTWPKNCLGKQSRSSLLPAIVLGVNKMQAVRELEGKH